MSFYRRALSYTKPYKKNLFFGIIFNFLYAIFNVLSLISMVPILGMLFGEKAKSIIKKPFYSGDIYTYIDYVKDTFYYQIQEITKNEGVEKVLLLICVFFVFIFLLRNICSFLSEYFLTYLRTGVSRDMRIQIHNKIIDLPVAYFSDVRKGDMMTRISSDVGEVESNILGGMIDIIRSPIQIIVILVSLFYLSFQMTIFSLIVFPIMGTIISLIGKSLKKDTGEAQRELGNVYSNVDESLVSLKIIKIFNAGHQIKNRFNASLNKLREISLRLFKRKALASPVSEFLGAITITLIVYFGGTLSLNGRGLSGAQFVAYIGLFYTILDPIKRFSRSLSDIQKGEVSAQRIFEVLDTDYQIKDKPNAVSIDDFRDKIEFNNISFYYESDRQILKDFSLIVKKGQTVALVGQSGSGKSTIANLITRFYDVTNGEIKLDGHNITDIKLKDFRHLFGLVTQDSILFNDSIFNNIALGIENPTQEAVEKAAKIANAHEFIIQLPNGYQTGIGEAGGKLSGGQKQRLSIARAVMKNPPIMILDEATSALDTESEKLVQEALEHMMENRTSLVIAHRLSTVQKADLIVVMEKGKIIEKGTHKDLIEKRGKYYQLIEMQGFE